MWYIRVRVLGLELGLRLGLGLELRLELELWLALGLELGEQTWYNSQVKIAASVTIQEMSVGT